MRLAILKNQTTMEENHNVMQLIAPQPPINGYQQTNPSGQTQTVFVNVEKKSNGMGVAGFVIALLSFVFCWVPILDLFCGS